MAGKTVPEKRAAAKEDQKVMGKPNLRPEPVPARRHVSCQKMDPACGRNDRERRWKIHRKDWRRLLRSGPAPE